MITRVGEWLQQTWPRKRQAVLQGYMVVGREKHFLADIALRGNVFGACHVPGDPATSAVNEGRRQMALEIIKLAGEEPTRLYALIERAPTSAERASARQSVT